MAITATFQADFTKFNQALNDAKAGLKNFEVVGTGTQRSLERLAKSFAGVEIKKQAELAAAAVEKVGGATKLTAAEQQKLTRTVDEALDKYKALGQVAPQSLIQLRGELSKIVDEEQKIKDGAAHLKALAGDTAGIAAPANAGAISFAKLTGSVLTAQAAYDAIRTTGRLVIQFLGESIESYSNAEAAQKKLTTALKAQGTATPQVIGQFNDLASSFQNTTIYSDDLINEMEALLVQVGSVMPQDMGKALTAATDLASGLGIDLNQATLLVGKTLEGNTGALGRYGIHLDDARVKAEGMDYVLGELEKRFGGQAQAQLDTYAGRIQHLANVWDNVKESVGKVIVTNPIIEAGLRGVSQVVDDVGTGSETAKVRVSDLAVQFGDLAGRLPVVGEGLKFVSLQAGGQIGVLEDLATAANDYYAILSKLSREAPKLQVNPGLPKITGGLEEFDKQGEAIARADKAAAAYTDTIRRLRDEMSGAALLKDLKDNVVAFNGLPKPIQDSTIAQNALADAYVRALPAMENASDSMLRQTSYAAGLAVSLGKLEPPVENAAKVLQGLGQNLSVDSFFGGIDSVGFEAALVRPFVSLKTEGGSIPTSVLFPIKKGMADLGNVAILSFSQISQSARALSHTIVESFVLMRGEVGREHKQLADEAIAEYERLRDSGTATPEEIRLAYAKMQTRIEEASHPWRDGMVDVWRSMKDSIAHILSEILDNFTNRFLKGLLASMTGAQGGFAGAFAGLFNSGGGGGLGGILTNGGGIFGGLLGGGGATGVGLAGTIPVGGGVGIAGLTGGGTAAGTGLAGLAGLFGGVGAGGAGLGLGFLGQKLFGGSGVGASAFGGASGAATGALIGSIVPGIGTAIGALIGGLSGVIGGLLGKSANAKANDSRDSFLSQFGGQGTGQGSGFGTLAAKLTEATGEAGGGHLFDAFLDAHKPEAVAKAIAEINAALDTYAKKTAAATANEQQQADAIAKTKSELEEKTKAIHDQMSGLDDELKRLDASEAPEAHMGTVEKRARERIAREKADLQAQLDAAQKAAADAIEAIKAAGTAASDELKTQGQDAIGGLKDGFVDLTTFSKDQIDEIRRMLSDLGKNVPSITIPIHYDIPEPPDGTRESPLLTGSRRLPGFADGTPSLGFMDFGREQLVRLHGREAVVPEGDAQRAARQWLGGSTPSRTIIVPAVFVGQPTRRDVDDFVSMLASAESAIAGNKAEVRTRLLDALGLN